MPLAGSSTGSNNESTSLLYSKLSAAKDYSTFLLGMAEHDPPVVVIPSKGKARSFKHSASGNGDGAPQVEGNHAVEQSRQPDGNGSSNRAQNKGDYNPIITILRGIWTNHDLSLDNVGSVARDHLANERTFLAWMRSRSQTDAKNLQSQLTKSLTLCILASLALSSIGVAITQLFRLTSSSYTLPTQPGQVTQSTSSSLPSASPTIQAEDLSAVVSSLIATVQQQQQAILALGLSTDAEKKRYQKLGKPIGGTFLILGLVFMALGELLQCILGCSIRS